jgi:hypothetical protein
VLLGIPTLNVYVGTLLAGEMLTMSVVATTPPRPSDTETLNESVFADTGALAAEAACRAADVGV